MNEAAGLILVSVCGRPAIWVCVDPEAPDEEARWILEHGWINPPEVALLLDGLPPRAVALDVGCGVGIFALAAAAAGAAVVAIDSARANVELVQAAARRNSFDRLRARCATRAEDGDAGSADAVRVRHATADAVRVVLGRPAVVFGDELRGEAHRLGRDLLVIDEARSGVLVQASANEPPSSASAWYAMLDEVPGDWRVEPALDEGQLLSRLIDQAGSSSASCRVHAARLLAGCQDPAAGPTRAALAIDVDPQVRGTDCCRESRAARDPGLGVGESVVRAASLSLPEGLTDAYFHVRAGQYVGLLAAPGEVGGRALLEAIAGFREPCGGVLEVLSRPTLVTALADALQPGLSVAQNLELLAAFVGAEVTEVDRRMPELARAGGFASALATPLAEASADVAERLMMSAVLGCTPGSLILLDGLPAIDAPQLRERANRLVRALLRDGTAIIQCVQDPGQLIARPDRLMWVRDGRLVHNGHAESIAIAAEQLLAAATG
jgi:ABC-type polysaccharide/polyol phosphate transport system ATPase subunit/SAM-dependent methyltransferase